MGHMRRSSGDTSNVLFFDLGGAFVCIYGPLPFIAEYYSIVWVLYLFIHLLMDIWVSGSWLLQIKLL